MKHFKATIKEKSAKDGLVHFLYPEYYGDVTKEYLIKFWGLDKPDVLEYKIEEYDD
jgi:hypothetical protein